MVSVEYFLQLSDQWRVGAAGVAGMDYTVFFELARRRRMMNDEFERVFADLRIMVDEAMKTMQKANESA